MSKESTENNNLKIWNILGKTDRAHTKGFKRAGGFSGTAIKPIYSIQQMTNMFGPVGFGWGYSKPEYVTHAGPHNDLLVYCTVGVWYKLDDVKSELFYGVGGDFAIVRQSAGLRADDEAFKKAFTDAMGNAFKHLGMSADVHMGQFDGSKYAADEDKVKTPQPTKKPEPVQKTASKQPQTMPPEEFTARREAILNVQNVDVLKNVFADAWKKAKEYGDQGAMKGLKMNYDKRLAELEAAK